MAGKLENTTFQPVFFQTDGAGDITFVSETALDLGLEVKKMYGRKLSDFLLNFTIPTKDGYGHLPTRWIIPGIDVSMHYFKENNSCKGVVLPLDENFIQTIFSESAEMVGQVRKHFHDIRSPLNAIKGISYLLKTGGVDEELQEEVEILELATNNLIESVKDMEDFLRPDQRKKDKEVDNNEADLRKSSDGGKTEEGQMLKGMKIVLADDDSSSRLIAENILKHHGAEVSGFENGLALLENIKEVPEMIMLDLEMPQMDGKRTIVELQKRFGESLCSTVALTGYFDARTEAELIALGFDDVFSKPFDSTTFPNSLLNVFKARKQDNLPRLEKLLDSYPIIDTKVLGAFLKYGDNSIIREVFDSFLVENRKEIEFLKTTDAEVKIDETKRILHSLRTSAASLGLFKVSLVSSFLEARSRKNHIKCKELSIIYRYFMEILSEWQTNVQKLYK